MPSPLLSVVITTKDRPRTAAHVVGTILDWSGETFELIVQDCSAGAELERELAAILDPRLSYEHTPPIDMTANWNAALARCKGEYVIVIGDDDGIDPKILDLAEWAHRSKVDGVIYPLSAFFWPDTDPALATRTYVPACTGRIWFLKDLAGSLERTSHGWGMRHDWGPERCQLPELYHGLIARRVLEAHAAIAGAFVRSYCPDLYASYALVPLVKRLAIVDYPFSISGKCGASNSHRMSTRAKLSNRERQRSPNPHFVEYEDERWHPNLPQMENRLVWHADTLLSALDDIHREDLARNVDLADVYASCVVDSPRRTVPIAFRLGRVTRSLGVSPWHVYRRFAWRLAGRATLATLRKVVRPKASVAVAFAGTAPDIRGAIALQQERLAASSDIDRNLSDFAP